MSWEDILKNDVEQMKQAILDHIGWDSSWDLGTLLEKLGRSVDMDAVIQSTGRERASAMSDFVTASQELKAGKMPTQSNVRVDPKTQIPWRAPASDPSAQSQREVDNPDYARIREGRGE
jgi:hypothetical protein